MATSYFPNRSDMNTAIRDLLNVRYGTTNSDLAPLLARYLAERADYDENMRKLLVDIAYALKGETVSTSGGPVTT